MQIRAGAMPLRTLTTNAPATIMEIVDSASSLSTGTRVRYRVLGLAVLLAAITYLDRICISLTAPAIMRDLGLSQVEMSFVFSAFTLAYGLFEIPTGWWGDRVGTRKVLTRIVIWWSAFTIATAAVFNYASLLVTRFLFGVGEAGAWPNAARTFSRWFPVTERGTAQGIFFMGAHLGGAITPILVTALLGFLPWRAVFVIFGAVGFVWAAGWYWWFRDEPEEHAAVDSRELDHIRRGRGAAESHHLTAAAWRRMVTNRSLLALSAAYFTQSYSFYFFITWLPTYLEKARGFTSTTLGIMAGLPLLLSVAADFLGGITTDRLTKQYGLRIGRAGVGGVSLLLASILLIAGTAVENAFLGVALISLALAFSNFLLGASWGTCVDLAGGNAGVVSGFMNTAGQIGGFLSPIVTALIVKHTASWSAPLYLCGLLYLAGALSWWLVDPRHPIDLQPEPQL
ncbi:MAG: MFS transporter [Blastocatellia bacterium]|nr:MFS transporter [Blastocatellia bacterium]